MLQLANRPVEDVIRFFAEWGVEAAYLVPTATGLEKSIMDAHSPLRDFLRKEGVHDFSVQAQGQAAKVVLPAHLLTGQGGLQEKASLYRPETKQGDPRIWISGLRGYAAPGDLLAILAHRGEIFVVNASTPGVLDSGRDPTSALGRVLQAIAAAKNEPVRELLEKLRAIAALGFVPSLRSGPTGVGMTLETMLGIQANSSKAPDYRGIELKASRASKGSSKQSNRITLFSKVPNWKASAIKTPVELLEKYGYDKGGRRQLYCSLNNIPNTLGLFLRTDGEVLHASHGTIERPNNLVQWEIDGLRASLTEKHQDTFWVKAVSRQGATGEEFHYREVLHTRAPLDANLKTLLELGHVELDFVLHLLNREPGQKPRARDHGYLFKIAPKNLDMLFPPSVRYSL